MAARSYGPSDIAAIAGINPETLRLWRHDGVMSLGEAAGNSTKYSMQEVVTLFVGKQISLGEFTLAEAFKVALSDEVQAVILGHLTDSVGASESYLFIARDPDHQFKGVKYAIDTDPDPWFAGHSLDLKKLDFKPDGLHSKPIRTDMIALTQAYRVVMTARHRHFRDGEAS